MNNALKKIFSRFPRYPGDFPTLFLIWFFNAGTIPGDNILYKWSFFIKVGWILLPQATPLTQSHIPLVRRRRGISE